jgi:hypothetical protein
MIVVPERWSLAAISLRRAFAFLILPRASAPHPLFAAAAELAAASDFLN